MTHTPSAKAIAQRIVNGETRLVNTLIENYDLDTSTASKIATLYLKEKIAKIDPIGGGYTIKHGAFLDPDVIARAKEMVQ